MKSGKKTLVGVGIIFVLSIIVALVIEGLFVEHIVDSEKQKHGIEFILPVEMSQDHGTAFTTPPWETMTVKIAKIEFYDEYAKIFISIENKDTRISELDPHYIHLYESKTLLPARTVRLALKHLMNRGYIKRKVSIRDARQKIYEITKLD